MSVVFDCDSLDPLRENMTLSTKPEVHNTLHSRHGTAIVLGNMYKNVVKFRNVVLEIGLCEPTDRQTYRHAGWSQYFVPLLAANERSKNYMSKFYEHFSVLVTQGRGLVLLVWQQCNSLCTFGFVGDTMFLHNGVIGPESMTFRLVKFTRCQKRRRRCCLRLHAC